MCWTLETLYIIFQLPGENCILVSRVHVTEINWFIALPLSSFFWSQFPVLWHCGHLDISVSFWALMVFVHFRLYYSLFLYPSSTIFLPLFLSPSSLSAHLLSLTSLTLSYDYFLHLKPVSPLFTRAAIKSTTGWVAYTRQIDFIPAMEAASPRSRCQRFWFPLWHLSLACGVVRKRDYLFFYTLPS